MSSRHRSRRDCGYRAPWHRCVARSRRRRIIGDRLGQRCVCGWAYRSCRAELLRRRAGSVRRHRARREPCKDSCQPDRKGGGRRCQAPDESIVALLASVLAGRPRRCLNHRRRRHHRMEVVEPGPEQGSGARAEDGPPAGRERTAEQPRGAWPCSRCRLQFGA